MKHVAVAEIKKKNNVKCEHDSQWFRSDRLMYTAIQQNTQAFETLAHKERRHLRFTVSPCVGLKGTVCRSFREVRINYDINILLLKIPKKVRVIRRCYGRKPNAAHVYDVTLFSQRTGDN